MMAGAIVDFEARRDNQGRIAIYKLPSGDGGGSYEVAGINDRYHPEECAALMELIKSGQHAKAEALAGDYIASYTDVVVSWCAVPAVESYLRDTCFNRGPTGAARIFQLALGVKEDGLIGAVTRAAAEAASSNPHGLLNRLRSSRETYERRKRDETSKFWKGLVNRWNLALEFAKRFLPDPQAEGLSFAGHTVSSASDPLIESSPVQVATGTEFPIIPALRQGSRGALVSAWQSFLVGQGFDVGVIDGDFGVKTRAATEFFQQANGLAVDGVAGRQTFLAAAAKGFALIEEPANDQSGSDWPPRPSFQPLVGNNARAAVFGRFEYVHAPVAGNKEAIRILGNWKKQNIISVPIPQLRKALGNQAPSSIQFHKKGADQLKGVWNAWEAAGLLDRVKSYEGGYVARFVRGRIGVLSNHAYGSAFDINASTNPLGARPPLLGEPGCVRELVQIANEWGMFWGGHFNGRPDGMHFEIAIVQ